MKFYAIVLFSIIILCSCKPANGEDELTEIKKYKDFIDELEIEINEKESLINELNDVIKDLNNDLNDQNALYVEMETMNKDLAEELALAIERNQVLSDEMHEQETTGIIDEHRLEIAEAYNQFYLEIMSQLYTLDANVDFNLRGVTLGMSKNEIRDLLGDNYVVSNIQVGVFDEEWSYNELFFLRYKNDIVVEFEETQPGLGIEGLFHVGDSYYEANAILYSNYEEYSILFESWDKNNMFVVGEDMGIVICNIDLLEDSSPSEYMPGDQITRIVITSLSEE